MLKNNPNHKKESLTIQEFTAYTRIQQLENKYSPNFKSRRTDDDNSIFLNDSNCSQSSLYCIQEV